jgi:signal transduction histidine kinase
MPLARETFGSTICVPLVYASDVIGVLMVVAGTRGRAFDQDDVRQLELVGAQAAVAISHGLLFSEQRELTHAVDSARSQLETVLVSTQNPVIAVDRRFRLIFANPAAHNLFGLTDASDGRYIADMLPPVAFPPDFRVALRDLYRNNAHIYEISLDDRVYLCHLARLGWPRVVGWVAVLNDVTQLKELDRLKSEMVRMTSHDLKNPLQAAMAHVDLLRDDLQDVSNSEVHLSLAAIEKQLERMNRIIRGILDLERADSGSFSFDLCQPEVVIANTLDELQHLAEDRQIVLKHETGVDMPEFWGDGEQFERALINLVENAIKFTPVGGTVSLNVDIDDRNLVFEIRDNGIGIPADLQAQIFDRFFRGRQKGVEHVSGSGLGLNLVKTVIENHNGEIRLESEEGAGTTFYVSVPIANEAEAT